MSLALVVVIALVAWGGDMGGDASPPTPPLAPKVVTQVHSGKTFRLALGRSLEIRLPHADWGLPKAAGAAVEIFPINFVRDPGYAAWAVFARRPGRATVTLRAQRQTFSVTLVVQRPS